MTTPASDARHRPRWMLVSLLALAAALLAGCIAAATLLTPAVPAAPVADGASTPTATSTPRPLPTREPTPHPTTAPPTADPQPEPAPPAPAPPAPPAPPANPAPAFSSFSPHNGASAGCADEYDSPAITFSWSSTNAHSAWIGISTQNAQQAPYSMVPVSGSTTLYFQCANESEIYTVTLQGDYGVTHKTITVTR